MSPLESVRRDDDHGLVLLAPSLSTALSHDNIRRANCVRVVAFDGMASV
jgi:hypothetical protein